MTLTCASSNLASPTILKNYLIKLIFARGFKYDNFLFYQKLIASDKTFAEIFFVLLSKCVYKLAVVEDEVYKWLVENK